MTASHPIHNNSDERDRISHLYQRLAEVYDLLGEMILGIILSPMGYQSSRRWHHFCLFGILVGA